MGEKDKVSIIIPVYNVENYINRCIESVLLQTYTNLEIIIINDGSTDNSLRYISKFQYDNRIIIINKRNGGLSSARNAGLNVATGKYIYFLDSDDYIRKDAISVLVAHMEKGEFDFICFNVAFFDERNKFTKKEFIHNEKEIIGNKLIINNFLNGLEIKTTVWSKFYLASFLYRSELEFEEGIINEDYLFTLQTCLTASRVKLIPDTLYFSMQRVGSITRDIKKENITDYLVIKNRIIEIFKYNRYNENLLSQVYQSLIRQILYTLVLCAYRSFSLSNYNSIYIYIIGTFYFDRKISRGLSCYQVYVRILYIISYKPKLFYYLIKVLKKTKLIFIP